MFLFTLQRIRIPTPAPTNNPASMVETVITPDKYNCVSKTEDAQLGISPIIPAKIGPRIGLFKIRFAIVSSPIR